MPADRFNRIADEIITTALREDVGSGDISSLIIPEGTKGQGYIIAGEELILAGLAIARDVFTKVDKRIRFVPLRKDGDEIKRGERIAEVYGEARRIMTAERTAINFLQYLSGIATQTRRFVEKIKPYGAILLDTRKTTPGLRLLEKYATRVGGARNHRMGLYDEIMIKSNHIKCAGGIENAIANLKKIYPRRFKKAMIEVNNLSELKVALASGMKYILLDNMSVDEIRESVRITKGRAVLEATGGITLGNIEEIASTGVNFISTGALTHSARWVNISLKMMNEGGGN